MRGLAPVVLGTTIALAGVHGCGDAPRFAPGRRVLLDAHNAYPYHGAWRDRVDRALATGVPVAIEQDLTWVCEPPAPCRSVVAHNAPFTGDEPTLRTYFFERIRPVVERALVAGDRRDWPLVTLNLDFKTNEPEHHAAVWAVLGEYERWLTTARRTGSVADIAPLDVKPVLVLTGSVEEQQVSFHDRLPIGGRLRVFGAVETLEPELLPGARTNYRRWWNHPWSVIESGGPREAGDWTTDDRACLTALVARAHAAGLWIRFYTLNGHDASESLGWEASYNFGSREAVMLRWRAAIEAGVDFVATDQYEGFAALHDSLTSRR